VDTIKFLSIVLGDDGRYCLWATRFNNNVAVQGSIEQSFYDSIEELAAAAHNKDKRGYDTYFAVGCIGEKDNRKASNVVSLKALFLDIDAGPTKDYASQREALAELRRFCSAIKLPKPLIVSSGFGLHVYWLLDKSLPRAEWVSIATLLKEQCVKHNLLVDGQCTVDAARILRVVGTHNQKWQDKTEVVKAINHEAPTFYDPMELKTILMDGMATVPMVTQAARDLIPDTMLDHYTRNITSVFGDIVKHKQPCAQIVNRLRTRHEATYDEWTQMLAIANKCEDREKAIRIISQGHPDYDFDVADAKAATFDGPTLCSTLELTTPGLCAGCPHQGKIKSPIVLGKKVNTIEEPVVVKLEGEYLEAEKEVVIPKFPAGYSRGENGGVYVKIYDSEGALKDTREIYRYDIYVHKVLKSDRNEFSAVIRAHLPHDGMIEFSMQMEQLTSKDEARKILARYGVVPADPSKVMFFLMQWVNELQAQNKSTIAHEQFGWSDDKKSFVWGEWIYHRDQDPQPNLATPATAAHMAHIKPKGDPAVVRKWIDQFGAHGNEVAQAILLYTLAAPLMAFTGINTSATNLSSEKSGIGKTSMVYVGLALWGQPQGLSMVADDTHNARMHNLQVLRHAPVLIDEMTNQNPQKLSDMIYAMSSGKQRDRMASSANAVRTRGKGWNTTILTTANDSLLDVVNNYKANPDAEGQRMCEFFVRAEDTGLNQDLARKLMYELENNYGYGASEYIQYLVDHANELESEVDKYRAELERLAGLEGPNRFWSAGWGCALLAGVISKKLGIHDYDLKRVRTYIVDKLKAAKRRLADLQDTSSPANLIGRFWYDNIASSVVVDSGEDARKNKNENGLDIHNTLPLVSPKNKLVARWEPDTECLYISSGALRKWCKEDGNRVSFTDLKAKMTSELQAKYIAKFSLGKGTNYAVTQVPVFVIKGSFLDGTIDGIQSNEGRANSA